MLLKLLVLGVFSTTAAATFNISNTLGDGMVLQRAPQSATVWGFGTAGAKVRGFALSLSSLQNHLTGNCYQPCAKGVPQSN